MFLTSLQNVAWYEPIIFVITHQGGHWTTKFGQAGHLKATVVLVEEPRKTGGVSPSPTTEGASPSHTTGGASPTATTEVASPTATPGGASPSPTTEHRGFEAK